MRRLVAALACRVNGSRLYGKPLQLLDVERGISVLDHIISLLATEPSIAATVLGISLAPGNDAFEELAARRGVGAIRGDDADVLARLVACGEAAGATDVFRVTTESPFVYFEAIAEAWRVHVAAGHDVTAVDGLPDGCNFEIFTLDALKRSHALGDARHRSELCSLYVREHRDEFAVGIVPVPRGLRRDDLRLTIDYPEDLIVCRGIYAALREQAPRLALTRIVDLLDRTPAWRALVAPFASSARLY
ncbi:MAG: acylneuraminate cytidylyltransferase [Acidobacteria bacterium]|nr:acylneuraminate cytidylyltransferase [Acidobacteriota bacterium]